MNDNHLHSYDSLLVEPLVVIDNPRYAGTAGDRAIIYHVCNCGHKEAFDYGKVDDMKQLKKEMES